MVKIIDDNFVYDDADDDDVCTDDCRWVLGSDSCYDICEDDDVYDDHDDDSNVIYNFQWIGMVESIVCTKAKVR